jgi:hypothetical protein
MNAVREGIVLGVLVGIWTFVMGLTGWYKHPVLLFAFFLVIPMQFAVIAWALGKTAATQGYWPQAREGVLLSLVASVIIFFSSLLFTTVAFPKYFEELRSMQEQMLQQAGKSEVEIKAMLDQAAQGANPLANAVNGVIGTIVTGTVFSLIVAAFARRKDSPGAGSAA